jgi:hypothetical protein
LHAAVLLLLGEVLLPEHRHFGDFDDRGARA